MINGHVSGKMVAQVTQRANLSSNKAYKHRRFVAVLGDDGLGCRFDSRDLGKHSPIERDEVEKKSLHWGYQRRSVIKSWRHSQRGERKSLIP